MAGIKIPEKIQSFRPQGPQAIALQRYLEARQGRWESPTSALLYFLNDDFGGEATVEFGAGLKCFCSSVAVNGKWSNVVLPKYTGDWVNSSKHDEA